MAVVCQRTAHCTVKPIYKDHPRGQHSVVLIHRWSLYVGSIQWKVYHWGPVKCGLYIQVVFRACLSKIDFSQMEIYINKVTENSYCLRRFGQPFPMTYSRTSVMQHLPNGSV